MFPGQGSQAVGMGCDLAAADPAMREAYAEASEVLGYDLEDLCCQGPIDRLSRAPTSRSRPCWPRPSACSASCSATACASTSPSGTAWASSRRWSRPARSSFADALRLVRRRGQEMLRAADANPGGMAAVIGLDDAVVEALCAEQDGVWPANFNSPGQVVVSGRKPALEALAEKAKAAGAKRVIPLAVSGAFHSPLVESALEPLREEFESHARGTRRTRRSSPAAASRFESDDFDELLQVQLVSPVRFSQSVSTLFAAGYDAFLEVGPGAVLTGLVKRIEPQAQTARVSDMETLTALRESGRYLEDA